jgi:ABC-type nitrate/sulfonate/bicarbonate transport system substrate-binding protein
MSLWLEFDRLGLWAGTLEALERWGLEPGKDVAVLQIGNTPARFGALASGAVDAAVMAAGGQSLQAKKSGLTILGDLSALGVEYLGNAVNVNRQFLSDRPDVVRRFMKGFVEGIHFLKTRKEESKATIAKYLRITDPELLEEGYQQYALKFVPRKPYPNPKGVQTILREIAEKEPKAREAKPEQFVDQSFVRELDESGYIDSLYK